MRGDYASDADPSPHSDGSPPHAWGLFSLLVRDHRPYRFTPTCVGTMYWSETGWACARFTPTCVGTIHECPMARCRTTVHPHMRGDYSFEKAAMKAVTGSPPHAWGLYRHATLGGPSPRFTPTCVGTMSNWASRAPSHCGSPPHAWGLSANGRTPGSMRRFTPTCVGTIHRCPVAARRKTVHPHMRGDYNFHGRLVRRGAGSPPHAWGLLVFAECDARGYRFTPTCVGTIHSRRRTKTSASVHPHMRGDYEPIPAGMAAANGSPPHAWGLCRPAAVLGAGFGSPPHAWGLWSPDKCHRGRRAVHPHMRGDYRVVALLTESRAGSPPHAWGL